MQVRKLFVVTLLSLSAFIGCPTHAQIPSNYKQVLSYLRRSGDFEAGVLKINIPRTDLEVRIKGNPVPTQLGFGGWIAMREGEGDVNILMGDLVLLQEEVNPVMSALLENGIEVTALHNHFFWERPRIFYMHVHAEGNPLELARKVRPALMLVGNGGSASSGAAAEEKGEETLNTKNVASIVGHEGSQKGPVYKITIGRDDLVVKERGAIIDARMGLNTWAAFTGTDEEALVVGDVAMLEQEVTSVLKALRKNEIQVVALHHHMTGVRPVVIFLHYWGEGPAEKLAHGVRAALDQLGR